MEGTTFIDESDMALCLEVPDGLTVLTLNCSLQYFYMTAIRDTKPLVLSFPFSLAFCLSRSVWLFFSSRGESQLPVGFGGWVLGRRLLGNTFFFFFWFFFTL